MTPEEIKAALSYNPGYFPSEAMGEAVAQREAMTPILLAELERMAARPQALVDEEASYVLHIFALYLLAQFREPGALAPLLAICRLPDDTLDFLLGDVVTEDLGKILASVCGGDAAPLKAIAEDDGIDEFVRGAGMAALLTLYAEGALEREELLAWLRHAHHGFSPDSPMWERWVSAANEIYPEELLPEIRAFYAEDLVDTTWIAQSDIDATLREGREAALARLRLSHHYVTDAARMLERWHCFRPEAATMPDEPGEPYTRPWYAPQLPYMRAEPKPGRNDPCPCGSGKKYKKCCLPR